MSKVPFLGPATDRFQDAMHTKMDRLLYGQERLLAAQVETNETLEILINVMKVSDETLAVLREHLAVLTKMVTVEEGGGEMRDLIVEISQSLKKITSDSARTVSLLTDLPAVVAQASERGARIANGEVVEPVSSRKR